MNPAEIAASGLEGAAPQYVLAWALEQYPKIVLSCSFGGPGGMVLLDMLMAIDRSVPVSYIDTDRLFPETYALIERVEKRYGIAVVPVRTALTLEQQRDQYGVDLWKRNPDLCCELRKVAPQREFLSQYDAWITGIRRDQSTLRATTPVVQWDAGFGLVKINPLAQWDEGMVWAYVRAHDLPYNELHDRGYPSIGCMGCTKPVADGDNDKRSGRWSDFSKSECGLHVPPK